MSDTKHLEMLTDDGPVVEVGKYGDQVTVRFDWSVNQRWYLQPTEARRLAAAIIAAADDVDPQTFEEHTAAAIEKILGA